MVGHRHLARLRRAGRPAATAAVGRRSLQRIGLCLRCRRHHCRCHRHLTSLGRRRHPRRFLRRHLSQPLRRRQPCRLCCCLLLAAPPRARPLAAPQADQYTSSLSHRACASAPTPPSRTSRGAVASAASSADSPPRAMAVARWPPRRPQASTASGLPPARSAADAAGLGAAAGGEGAEVSAAAGGASLGSSPAAAVRTASSFFSSSWTCTRRAVRARRGS
jgi:hypothetical protein